MSIKATTAVRTNDAGLRRVHGSARADWPTAVSGPEVGHRGPPAGQWFPQPALEVARLVVAPVAGGGTDEETRPSR